MSKISLSDRQKGMISIILSAFCFAWMNAFVRLSGDLPFIEKSFFRNFVALLLALVMLLREHGSFRPKKGAVPYLLIRASAGTLSSCAIFTPSTIWRFRMRPFSIRCRPFLPSSAHGSSSGKS